MTKAEFIARYCKTAYGPYSVHTEADARYYAAAYPSADWPEILAWVARPPDLDACDDFEADGRA